MKPDKTTKRATVRLATLALGIMVAGCGREPELYSPPGYGDPTKRANPPAVKIIEPVEGQTFRAHADIRLLALATPNGTDLGPVKRTKLYSDPDRWDLMMDPEHQFAVAFQAGTNSLGMKMNGMITAHIRPHPGQAEPMIVGVVGFPAVEWVWQDVPAGSYALTATVTNANGQVTVSAPVDITVLP